MIVLVLDLIARFFAWLPRPAALSFGRGIGWAFGHVLRHRRREAGQALARSLPHYSLRERTRILNLMYLNLGMTLVEQLRVCVLGLQDVEGSITVHGEQYLRDITSKETGAIGLMAHLGNWELCGYATTLVDRPISVVVKPMKTPRIDTYIRASRERMNLHLLPAKKSYKECLQRLRRGEILAMIMDQNVRHNEGVFVEFFGKPACTTAGLAILSAQTGCPVIPLFITRKPGSTYDMFIGEPIAAPPNRKLETLRTFTQVYTRVIEDMIRKYPDQWIWIHRRWRTQPPPTKTTPPSAS